MSKKWYPVINTETCSACGACVAKCSHGVYEAGSNPPKVVYAEGCIDGCRGCQNLCPTGSIDYVGDMGKDSNSSCSCSCV